MMGEGYECGEDFRAYSLEDVSVVEMSLTEVTVTCPCCEFGELVSTGVHQPVDLNGHPHGPSFPCTLCRGVGKFTYTRADA